MVIFSLFLAEYMADWNIAFDVKGRGEQDFIIFSTHFHSVSLSASLSLSLTLSGLHSLASHKLNNIQLESNILLLQPLYEDKRIRRDIVEKCTKGRDRKSVLRVVVKVRLYSNGKTDYEQKNG